MAILEATKIRLYLSLRSEPGQATVNRKVTEKGTEQLLVTAYPGSSVKPSDLPPEFEGYPVVYQKRNFPTAY